MTCLARRAQPTQAHKTRRTQALGAFHAERWQELPSPPAPREPRTTFADRNSSPQRRQGSPLGVAPKPENGPDQIPKGPRPNSRRAPTKFQKRARPNSKRAPTKFQKGPDQIPEGPRPNSKKGPDQIPKVPKPNSRRATNQILLDLLPRPIAQQKIQIGPTKLDFVRPLTHFAPVRSSNLGAKSGGDLGPWPPTPPPPASSCPAPGDPGPPGELPHEISATAPAARWFVIECFWRFVWCMCFSHGWRACPLRTRRAQALRGARAPRRPRHWTTPYTTKTAQLRTCKKLPGTQRQQRDRLARWRRRQKDSAARQWARRCRPRGGAPQLRA